MSAYAWKDNELAYCQRIVLMGGAPEVPAELVGGYILLQMASAQRDGSLDALAAYDMLAALLNDWNTRRTHHAK